MQVDGSLKVDVSKIMQNKHYSNPYNPRKGISSWVSITLQIAQIEIEIHPMETRQFRKNSHNCKKDFYACMR